MVCSTIKILHFFESACKSERKTEIGSLCNCLIFSSIQFAIFSFIKRMLQNSEQFSISIRSVLMYNKFISFPSFEFCLIHFPKVISLSMIRILCKSFRNCQFRFGKYKRLGRFCKHPYSWLLIMIFLSCKYFTSLTLQHLYARFVLKYSRENKNYIVRERT